MKCVVINIKDKVLVFEERDRKLNEVNLPKEFSYSDCKFWTWLRHNYVFSETQIVVVSDTKECQFKLANEFAANKINSDYLERALTESLCGIPFKCKIGNKEVKTLTLFPENIINLYVIYPNIDKEIQSTNCTPKKVGSLKEVAKYFYKKPEQS